MSGETANPFNSNDAAITDNDKPYLVVYGQDAEEGQPVQFTVNLTQPSPARSPSSSTCWPAATR